jgi:hypothetical protein
MSSKKRSKALVKQSLDFRVPEGVTLSAIQEALVGLDCPRSLAVSIIIRDDPIQLKTLDFNPLHYDSLVRCRDAYAATKLVSKANFLKSGVDTQKAALTKFFLMEELCKQTNRRLGHLAFDPLYKGPNVWLLNAFTRKIASVLVGYSPEELFDEANWGPGVTTRIKGVMATATNKFQFETGITRDLYYLVSRCLPVAYPAWGDHLEKSGYPTFDIGNQVVTVPKDAFTDRVIAVEPGINLWFQKAIGSMIRRRLLCHGIDLNSQERNQQLARSGSKDSVLATIDFSSASDTISKVLIRECFPSHWYELMDSGRSHFGLIDAKPVLWEKFSSMGNGFTFELESLIFYAAAYSVCKFLKLENAVISVYGDDVILPSSAVDLFSSFCEFLGFKLNVDKSYFGSVAFRESCGAHFYDGVDIKPIFLKKIAQNLFELYRQANAIRRWAHTRCNKIGCDAALKRSWLTLFREVPRCFRIYGPDGKGDGFILGNLDEATPVVAGTRESSYQWEGYYIWQFTHVGKTRRSEEVGLLLDRLRNRSTKEYGNNYTLRGQTRVSLMQTLVEQWYDLGPWF